MIRLGTDIIYLECIDFNLRISLMRITSSQVGSHKTQVNTDDIILNVISLLTNELTDLETFPITDESMLKEGNVTRNEYDLVERLHNIWKSLHEHDQVKRHVEFKNLALLVIRASRLSDSALLGQLDAV